MVGSAIAKDLASEFSVTVADLSEGQLEKLKGIANVVTKQADLSNPSEIKKLVQEADFVVGAVPGFMGFSTLKTIIEQGKNVVDISFFPEDAFLLDEIAKKQNVTAIVDCGVAPGMSNMLLGYHHERMDIESFECYVGGLPAYPQPPFNYKAPFSPADVIEEYVRTARIVEHRKVVEKPALTEVELLEFETIGQLEAFNSDGLRSLIKTMDVPNMKEKTMRYPGHAALMKTFRETGLFSTEPVLIGKHKIRPLDLTSKLLFKHWKLGETEEEFTVMRVIMVGLDIECDTAAQISYDLLDRYDHDTNTSSMARTTGYTCSAAVHLLANGDFTRKGICPPEFIGAENGCLDKVLEYLEQRRVVYMENYAPIRDLMGG